MSIEATARRMVEVICQQMIDSGYEKEHPLWRQKCEEKLHGIKDRAEMIDACHSQAEHLMNGARHLALDVLRAEEAGDYAQAECARSQAFHQTWFAEKWLALALWMTPNRDLGRDAPREEECAKAVAEFWSPAHDAECWRAHDEYRLRRAERAVALVRLGHCASAPGQDVDIAAVAELFVLPAEELRARVHAVDRMPSVVKLEPGEEPSQFNPIAGCWVGQILRATPERCKCGRPCDEYGRHQEPCFDHVPRVREMADYIQESISVSLQPFVGKPNAEETRKQMVEKVKDELEVHLTFEDPDRIARLFQEGLMKRVYPDGSTSVTRTPR